MAFSGYGINHEGGRRDAAIALANLRELRKLICLDLSCRAQDLSG